MAHTSYEIAVCSGNTSLTGCQNSHISPKAGAAGRCTHHSAGLDKDLQKPLSHSLKVNGLGCRDHNAANALCHLFPFQDLCRCTDISDPPIGTGADYRLVNLYIARLINGLCIGWQMRK